jgi:SAM-dependent methyltransferase
MSLIKKFWEDHNVTSHSIFKDAEASLKYFHWRNSQYFNYIQLMPVTGQDNKIVLDYGCGPGNDLVGFSVYSKPKQLIGVDVSEVSINEAKARLNLHGVEAQMIIPLDNTIPLENESIDYIHSSGVLHHTDNMGAILAEFQRILKPGGECRIMVYNYDSIWLHLYTAYQKMIVEGLFEGLSIRDAFAKTTDGPNCPVSNVYKHNEFIEIVRSSGFDGQFLGAAISMHELSLCYKKFDAIMNQAFREESRDFLLSLTIDKHGYPLYGDHYAGVDGCYLIKKY